MLSNHTLSDSLWCARPQAQSEAIHLLASHKANDNPENTVGILTLAGKNPRVLVTPTSDLGKILGAMHGLGMEGETDVCSGMQVTAPPRHAWAVSSRLWRTMPSSRSHAPSVRVCAMRKGSVDDGKRLELDSLFTAGGSQMNVHTRARSAASGQRRACSEGGGRSERGVVVVGLSCACAGGAACAEAPPEQEPAATHRAVHWQPHHYRPGATRNPRALPWDCSRCAAQVGGVTPDSRPSRESGWIVAIICMGL
jgi:hypothetical protein